MIEPAAPVRPEVPEEQPVTAPALPRLLDAEAVGAWLGISPRGARMLMARELPAFRLGRRLVVREEDLAAALAAKASAAVALRNRASIGARVLAGLPARPKRNRD